ncbi:MAG TPA: hypothetical protein VN260_01915, partial [Dissulfurispiraceae bacterium]|nr:hypothetical protein [Dissulfurispiraceae bacterium]
MLLFDTIGKKTISLVNNLGAATIFFTRSFLLIFRPKQVPPVIQQVFYIGATSSGIIMMVALFTGMVLG